MNGTMNKLQKQKHKNFNRSCTFNQKKTQFISNIDHITSYTSNAISQNYRNSLKNDNNKSGTISYNKIPKKKQRSQSAHLIKGDKFVNKLLDMSVLVSELGGSITVND